MRVTGPASAGSFFAVACQSLSLDRLDRLDLTYPDHTLPNPTIPHHLIDQIDLS